MDLKLKEKVLSFVQSNSLGEPGKYRYSQACSKETLYSSCYAAMLYSLFGEDFPDRQEWIEYLCKFQGDDGLFKDPVIYGYGWYEGDFLNNGRPHLSCHVLIALTCLGAVAPREISFVKPWEDIDYLVSWLDDRGKKDDMDNCNGIMNVGTLLQYERDFHGNDKAGRAVEVLLEWLNKNRMDYNTGLWENYNLSDPIGLSEAVQSAYHLWELYFYDGVPIPAPERAAETVLRTQNPLGGFGWGSQNPENPYISSACEDIDSLVPLARLYRQGIVKNETVKTALERGLEWVKSNQMSDGGFVFTKNRVFEYGHPQLRGMDGHGAMFPTWFRMLTIALVSDALGIDHYNVIRCPGYQFIEKKQEANYENDN